MRAHHRIAGALCAALILAVAAGCGATSDDDDGGGTTASKSNIKIPQTGELVDTSKWKKDGPWTIGYSDASLSNSWRVFAFQYLKYEASREPIKQVIHTNANDSTPKQVSDIQDLLSRNVDCMIVAATSDTALNPIIKQASSRVPVVIMERNVTTPDYTAFASLDATDMGRQQADALVKQLGGKGNIIILQGVAGAGPVTQSLAGMKEVLAKNPGIKVLRTAYTDWSRDKGRTIMEDALQAYPQIDGVLSDSGIQAQGALEAVKAADRTDEIKAWTGDSLQGWLRDVNTNKLPGIVVDRPTKVGQNAMAMCAAILRGQEVPKVWKTQNQQIPAAQITKYVAPQSPGSNEWWDWWNLPKGYLPKSQ